LRYLVHHDVGRIGHSNKIKLELYRSKLLRILIVHNEYGIFTGEEAVIRGLCLVLAGHGHEIIPYFRSSTEILRMRMGEVRAFFSGIYSWESKREIRRLLKKHKPDIIQLQNVFPLISPSILSECRNAGVPVVMTIQNYRLLCPTGLCLRVERICRKCDRGEYWCIIYNCMGNWFKSVAYALRNYVARKGRLFQDNVTLYIAPTEFHRQELSAAGYAGERIVVIPNMIDHEGIEERTTLGDFVGFSGRVSPEKGVSTLVQAARQCPHIPFKAAGDHKRMPDLLSQAPSNFEFLGNLDPKRLAKFYQSVRISILPSTWYEGFPIALLEAMLRGIPVICSRIGGLPEIVEDGVTGLLFEPGNSRELAEKIQYLWNRPELCHKLGNAAREKALREYSPDRYYERLIIAYEKAIKKAWAS